MLYKLERKKLKLFIVHPGGPFWKNKDLGAWSVPKGEYNEGEEPLTAAIREFEEETGKRVEGNFISLGSVRMKSGKLVEAWAVEGEIDPTTVRSNRFPMEWPPKSGKTIMVEEVDKGDWFLPEEAMEKLNPAQVVFVERLLEKLGTDGE